MDKKVRLTFHEKIRCAYAHYVLGIEQQHIAMILAVNLGRVNEACKAFKRIHNEDHLEDLLSEGLKSLPADATITEN